jgi:signal transduction histidine kinase
LKLLTKTTLFFLTIALFILFAGGIAFYFTFKYMMSREVNRELLSEMHGIIRRPPQPNIIGTDSVVFDLPVHYQIIPIEKIEHQGFIYRDTILYDDINGDYQLYRMINYQTVLAGKPVNISISKSLLVADELVGNVAFVTLGLSLFLLLFIIGTNNYFFSHIWGNFFETIDVIKDYNIAESKSVKFTESEITEFNELNLVFEKMHERIKRDYQNLKEFIENISHEIQNPLAVIKSKVDLLQQYENLDKSQFELIQSIQTNANRLSGLNRSLILLSKIDNNQFPVREKVDILANINFHLENFEDIIESKNITLTKNLSDQIIVSADPSLISILLLNLLKNSIYHNMPSGRIEITTNSNSLIIKNTGKNLDINPEDLFNRFTKSSSKPDSLGLGLSIVKKICEYYNYSVKYTLKDSFHIVSIGFK